MAGGKAIAGGLAALTVVPVGAVLAITLLVAGVAEDEEAQRLDEAHAVDRARGAADADDELHRDRRQRTRYAFPPARLRKGHVVPVCHRIHSGGASTHDRSKRMNRRWRLAPGAR